MNEKPKIKCPICKEPATEKYFPFCSKLCAYRDLNSWFKEDYKIATDETEIDDEAKSKLVANTDNELTE